MFKAFALTASVAVAGFLLASPASAAPLGVEPTLAQMDVTAATKAQYWGRPDYGYERPYYGPRRYSAPRDYDPPPRNRRYYSRGPDVRRPAYVQPRGRTGCYTPPPMPYRTPRVICRY